MDPSYGCNGTADWWTGLNFDNMTSFAVRENLK
jgi:hypothetical protein